MCTSGTAVANLHPAVLEAAHAGVPLVVVTADRPARMRGTGANQTTDQVGVFGPLVATRDLSAATGVSWPGGPPELDTSWAVVHLNVQLDDPLVPGSAWEPEHVVPGRGPQRLEFLIAETIDPGPPTVVVAGDDAGPPARQLAESAGWPLLAEPSSGARTGSNPVRCYRLLLATPLADEVRRVVLFGHPTLSRPVQRLLAREDVEVVDAGARGVWPTRPHPVARLLMTGRAGWTGDGPDDPAWLARWRDADRDVSRRLDALLAAEPALTPWEVAGAVSRAVPPGGLLHVGASNPIRDLDLMVAPYAVGDRRMVVANRGLAGIDGTVSAAIGATLGRPRTTRALALMGDVTFLHDANGLVLGPDEPRPDLQLVVVNDDGGSIFSTLEQGGPDHAHAFERLFGTPHGVDLAALCAATRTPHLRVSSLPELEQALDSPNGGIEVVEARVGRADRRALDERIRSLVDAP